MGRGLAEAGDASQDDIDALLNQGPAAAAPAAPAAPRAPLEDFASAPKSNGMQLGLDGPNLDVILDIPVSISMEVGSTEISIRNLLQLNQGSVVELDRLAGEPLDVLVNGTLIAHGEVVVVNEVRYPADRCDQPHRTHQEVALTCVAWQFWPRSWRFRCGRRSRQRA